MRQKEVLIVIGLTGAALALSLWWAATPSHIVCAQLADKVYMGMDEIEARRVIGRPPGDLADDATFIALGFGENATMSVSDVRELALLANPEARIWSDNGGIIILHFSETNQVIGKEFYEATPRDRSLLDVIHVWWSRITRGM